MTDQEQKTATEQASQIQEHDNRWLAPYLKSIADKGEEGLSPSDADMDWPSMVDENAEAPASPSKIRQTMYIAKLAAKSKIDGNLHLTEKGRELLAAVYG